MVLAGLYVLLDPDPLDLVKGQARLLPTRAVSLKEGVEGCGVLVPFGYVPCLRMALLVVSTVGLQETLCGSNVIIYQNCCRRKIDGDDPGALGKVLHTVIERTSLKTLQRILASCFLLQLGLKVLAPCVSGRLKGSRKM